jgi:hypothetical protein
VFGFLKTQAGMPELLTAFQKTAAAPLWYQLDAD